MSETAKAAETMKQATDQARRSSQAGLDAAGRTAKEALGETSRAWEAAVEHARDAGESMTETVADTAHAATNMSSRATEQSRDAMMAGLRSAADVGSRVADSSFGRGQHLMASAVQAMDIYRDASARSGDRVHALFSSAMAMGRGLQSMQHAWLEMMDHTMEHAAHKPQDLLRCRTMVEVAEVQRDLYLDAINHAFESTSRLLDLAGRTAQDAVRPLRL